MFKRRLAVALVGLLAVLDAEGRSRAVRHPCAVARVTLSVSSTSVCANDSVELTWTTSDLTARVAIDGIGTDLPPNGSRLVAISHSTTFYAIARSACGGSSPAATADVAMRADAVGNLSAPATAQQGSVVSVFFSTQNANSWSITSSLGNGLNPSYGYGNGDFSSFYYATVSGTDTLQLRVWDSCGAATVPRSSIRTISVPATSPSPTPAPFPAPPPPTPPPTPTPTPTPTPVPPPSGSLRCCDGTLSPTCNSCANKTGCCSHHGGVCGCP